MACCSSRFRSVVTSGAVAVIAQAATTTFAPPRPARPALNVGSRSVSTACTALSSKLGPMAESATVTILLNESRPGADRVKDLLPLVYAQLRAAAQDLSLIH